MNREIVRSTRAQEDFDDIFDYFLARYERAAQKFAVGVKTCCKLLASQPHLGRAQDELRPGLRSIVIGDYLLFYRVTAQTIEIVRFINGACDLRVAFK